MKRKDAFLIAVLFWLCVFANAADCAVLVRNSSKDIKACKGKLKLKLVRIWGGAEEEDENKFFETPIDVAADKNKRVFICDMHRHCIKVFESSGKYVRTIGRKGRGPQDMYAPKYIAISPNGGLTVYEFGGRRIQRFNSQGKSEHIIKQDIGTLWLGVTSNDEMAVYNHGDTFRSRKLISIIDNQGKTVKQIGTYHDKSKKRAGTELLRFAIDNNDNIYAANMYTPLIRKYSPDGKLLMAVTFKTPFKIPGKITLNTRGDEIKRKGGNMAVLQVERRGNITYTVKDRVRVVQAIGADSQERIYIVTRKRLLTDKEKRARVAMVTVESTYRGEVDFDIVENIDVNRLLVFNTEGKVIAEAPLTTFCDGIHVNGDHIFIIDGYLNQRVLEYEMHFEQ